jgi:lipopolysaccharide transport system permease protein
MVVAPPSDSQDALAEPAAAAPAPRGARKPAVHVYTATPSFHERLVSAWRHRALVRYFGKLYVQRRYRRAWLGWLWLPLRPTADVFGRVLLFGGLLSVSSGTRPYFVFYIVGATAWRFFQMGIMNSMRSLELNRTLFQRINLPRATAVAASVVPAAIEALSFALVGVVGMVYFKITEGSFYIAFGPSTLVALAGVALLTAFVFAIGLWTAPMSAAARDIRFLVGYVIGFWYVATPVIYPISSIPQQFRPIAEYNPITAPVEMVKHGLMLTAPPTMRSTVVSLASLAVILAGGLVWFWRMEAKAAAAV